MAEVEVNISLNELPATANGEWQGAIPAPSAVARRVVTDSRAVREGDLFWALPGTCTDGADYVSDAWNRGALAVVTSREVSAVPAGGYCLRVADALAALWAVAADRRQRFCGKLVGVTGSVGKTTARGLIAQLLDSQFRGISTSGNYNNHVGLPLSMLPLSRQHDFAVLEMGASRPGEIADLAALCQPHVGVITAVGEAHLASFGSREQVALAKSELLSALPADGLAVINGDDPELCRLASRSRAPVVRVGRNGDCELAATRVRAGSGWIECEVAGHRVRAPLWGRHQAVLLLAAIAVARHFGVPMADMSQLLASFEPEPWRCEVRRCGGVWLINDAYNASPQSMRAALELLRNHPASGRRVVVCGDMLELGERSENYHRDLGRQVVTVCGADLLVACGQHALEVVQGARAAGMPARHVFACSEREHVLPLLLGKLRPRDAVLFKASRALGLERLVGEVQRHLEEWNEPAMDMSQAWETHATPQTI